MKKIYSLFVALVAMFCGTVAVNAASVTLKIDDASRVKVTIDSEEQTIVTGDNVIEYDANSYAYMEIAGATGDYGISNVHAAYSDGSGENVYMWSGKAGISLSAYADGAVYTVTSFSYTALRTATCTVNVDDASKVSFQRGSSTVELVNGDNTIAFIPDGDNAETFSIRGTSGSLYQVLHNGEVASTDWSGSYSISPKAGDIIKIEANFPDVDVPVRFIAVNEGTEGFVTNVTVDGQTVTNYWDENFSIKLGATLEWSPNEADYKLNTIWLNGEESYMYNCRNITALTSDSIIIKYDAAKYKVFNITINVDHAERLTLSKKVNYTPYVIPLVDGENKIEVSEACSGLTFSTDGGYWVESFKDEAGTEYKDYPSTYTDIPVADGKVFTIVTGAVERNAKFVFYVDDPSQCEYGGGVAMAADNWENTSYPIEFQHADESFIEGGYYTVPFDVDFDNPIQLNFYSPRNTPIVLQQDTVVSSAMTSPRLTVADGDVIKVFLAGAPDTLDVTFEAKDCIFENVVRDLIVPVEDVTAPLAVLTGTQISFRALPPAGTQNFAVKQVLVNDEAVTADEDGVYTITVTADTKIVASAGNIETSIDNVEAVMNSNVYTLQGVLLIQDATEAQINALPAGLYIINGKTTYLLQR